MSRESDGVVIVDVFGCCEHQPVGGHGFKNPPWEFPMFSAEELERAEKAYLKALARWENDPERIAAKASMERVYEDFLERVRRDIAKLPPEPADPGGHARWLKDRDALALLIAARAEWSASMCRGAALRAEQEPVLYQVLLDALQYCEEQDVVEHQAVPAKPRGLDKRPAS